MWLRHEHAAVAAAADAAAAAAADAADAGSLPGDTAWDDIHHQQQQPIATPQENSTLRVTHYSNKLPHLATQH